MVDQVPFSRELDMSSRVTEFPRNPSSKASRIPGSFNAFNVADDISEPLKSVLGQAD